ncbi:hypothetical protein HPB51_008752 [Rhipicephalus microplus]|uniref:Uncharacterized protein n=1 Tax=Rhipicephalus microplus TaxID=6941 RepID=A0A9J6EGM5_RHIMP|nr:hypothetical protein HPB51_008752 [Rhipicephalus microplus]
MNTVAPPENRQVAPFCLAGRIQCSTFTCSWPVTGPRPCLDKLTIPSGRLPGHADNIRAPVRPQAGPPGPFKSTKRRGAALTLTRRACTSTMQSPAQHSTPTTTYALSVSPASSGRTPDTAVPPLSPSGNVTSPAPTTIQQQAAFLNSAHGPATCNAGGVSSTLSLIATQRRSPRAVMQRWNCNQPRLLLSPPYLRLAYPLEIPSLSTSAFRRASFLPSPKFCLPSLQLTTYRRKWTSRHRKSTKTIRHPLKAAGTPLVPIENLPRPPVPAPSSSPSESNFHPEHSRRNCLSQ